MERDTDRNLTKDLGRFLIGLVMFISGGYLFTTQVQVRTQLNSWRFSPFGMGVSVSPFAIALILFMIGVGLIFFNIRSIAGWSVTAVSVLLIIIIVIAGLNVHFVPTTLFVVLGMLLLLVGGIGLMVRAVMPY